MPLRVSILLATKQIRCFICFLTIAAFALGAISATAATLRLKVSGMVQHEAVDFRSHKPLQPRFFWYQAAIESTNYRIRVKATDFTGIPAATSEGYVEVTGVSNTVYEVTVFEPSMLKPNAAKCSGLFSLPTRFSVLERPSIRAGLVGLCIGTVLGSLEL